MRTDETEEQLEIPDSALVQCPLVGFDMRPVSACATCPKFAGLEDRFPGGPHPFHKRYTVKCLGEPVRRGIVNLTKG